MTSRSPAAGSTGAYRPGRTPSGTMSAMSTANLYAWFRERWRDHLDAPALVVAGGATWRYRDLDDRVGALAAVLARHGAIGDRVMVQVDKSPDAVALYLACLSAGRVFVPLNTAYTPAEVDFFAGDATPVVWVGRPDHHVPEGPAAYTLADDGTGSLLDAIDDRRAEPVERTDDDWVAMLYTSGTTGRSKGAMLSARNLRSNAEALRTVWDWRPDDVLVHALPIFHVHGLFVALHCALAEPSPVRFLARFDTTAVLDALDGASVLMGVPTHYTRLLDGGLDAAACRTMRLFTSGSAPMTAATHATFTERTGHHIVERYGMTEAMIITSNRIGDTAPGTVGVANPGIEVRVRDGIVECRGPNTFLGYWGLADKTAETIGDDGWLVTGDVGSIDDDGRVTLAGRQSDLIISGGLNIYPKEIETAVDRVAGVVESAVVGVPHPDFGEGVLAVVVADRDLAVDEVRAACVDLAAFKHPRAVARVEALPRNAMGKVQKTELRRRFASTFSA